jgi:hypothetical protein
MFYYRSANQYVAPTHFSAWIINKNEPRLASAPINVMAKKAIADMSMMAEKSVAAPMVAPVASYEDAREYKIKNLTLPSTGVPLEAQVLTWKAPLVCEIRTYPYENTKAFHVCSFVPKYQIDNNRWKVKSTNEIVNENAIGEYRKDAYDLYIKVEDDIQIERKPIVNNERETGVFGGTVRKKDGFTLTLINKSDTIKTIVLTERIPTSTTEKITSKLLSINSEKKVDYKILEDGQIEMNLTLEPNENKKIKVLFEVSYDKDLQVSY